jgi:hypothetical protein
MRSSFSHRFRDLCLVAAALSGAGCGHSASPTSPAGPPPAPVAEPERLQFQQNLEAREQHMSDTCGGDVALDAQTALVGCYNLSVDQVALGGVYVFGRSGARWTQKQLLLADDHPGDVAFGTSVALADNVALVGAPWHSSAGEEFGAAYLFAREADGWKPTQRLLADDGRAHSHFGMDVALSGDFALVGAPDDDNREPGAGAVYAFTRGAKAWAQGQKILAESSHKNDSFGSSLALAGDVALVGARFWHDARGKGVGAVYVLQREGQTWRQKQVLTASDGKPNARFGSSIALSGNVALIGADQDDGKANTSGAAYVFVRQGAQWVERQKLTAPVAHEAGRFGMSVALSPNSAIVAADQAQNAAQERTGSVHVFLRAGQRWPLQQTVFVDDGKQGDYFGAAVAISGRDVLVGAPGRDGHGADTGTSYLFSLSSSPSD